jgi:hypothetical protein
VCIGGRLNCAALANPSPVALAIIAAAGLALNGASSQKGQLGYARSRPGAAVGVGAPVFRKAAVQILDKAVLSLS